MPEVKTLELVQQNSIVFNMQGKKLIIFRAGARNWLMRALLEALQMHMALFHERGPKICELLIHNSNSLEASNFL